MLRRRPDLIVPIRDRRQHKRYLTLKNSGLFALVCVVAFAAITIRSEMRDLQPGDYGRLFGREAAAPIEQKPIEVVHEAPPPVDDATHADPMLVEPAERAQWLQDDTTTTTAAAPITAPVVTAADIRGSRADVAIVGGADGVAVVRTERKRPVLSGGFGRQ